MGRLAGGFSAYAARGMAAAVLGDLSFVATSDESRFDPDAKAISPTAEPVCRLAHVLAPEYAVFAASRRAWAAATEIASLPFVRRIVGVSPTGQPLVQTRLEGRLEHSGISRLEVEFRLALRNAHELSSALV